MKTQQKPARRAAKKHISLVIPERLAPVAVADPPAPVATIAEQLTDTADPAPAGAPAREKKPAHPAVAEIAEQLGESKPGPLKQIKMIVWALGATQARELAARAKEIHAGPGMLVSSGQRKRTLGGCFFALAYGEGEPKEGRVLTKPDWNPRGKKKTVQAEDAQVVVEAGNE